MRLGGQAAKRPSTYAFRRQPAIYVRLGGQPPIYVRLGSQPAIYVRLGSQPAIYVRLGGQPAIYVPAMAVWPPKRIASKTIK